MRVRIRASATVAVVVLAVLAAATAAAQTSSQTQAADQACFARAKIGSNATVIAGQVISPGTATAVRGQLEAIRANLATIRTTLRDLPAPLRQQFVIASTGFVRQLARIAPTLLRAPTGPAPQGQFVRFTLAKNLVTPIYQRTLGAVAC